MAFTLENRQTLFDIDLHRIEQSMKTLQDELHCRDREIGLLLVDDEQIQEINLRYLNRNRPTNVISFAMTEGEFGDINPLILGDIVISVETASRDASAGQIELMDELDFLLIHGLLHLLGYNHEGTSAEKAREMRDREQELFYRLRHYHLD